MRNAVWVSALVSAAALAASDFKDMDVDLMRDMDDAIKSLEPALGAGNVGDALDDAQVLRDGLKWTDEYFSAKGNVEDGARIARDGRELVAQLIVLVDAGKLDAAIEAARNTSRNCRRCHDIYKP